MHSLSVCQAGAVQYSKIMTENKICKSWTWKEDKWLQTDCYECFIFPNIIVNGHLYITHMYYI